MLRIALIAAAFAACASAMAEEPQERAAAQMEAEGGREAIRRDGFVISGDACGASRYAHLLGENYAELYHAALLPDDSVVTSRAMMRTLEYEPAKLNIILDGEGRVQAVGCF